jgi:predicted esterase
MVASRLVEVSAPREPQAAVIVLHGGAARQDSMRVSPTQLSVLRMIPIARRVAHRGRGRLAVHRLLNSHRGWDTHHTPVQDVQWAIGELRDRLGDLPIGLVGHSLGGRAALLAGGEYGVRSVVALAPWVYPNDSADLSGRQVLIVHGDQDRVARPDRSLRVAQTLLARSARVGYVEIRGGKHAMLRHHEQYDGYAAAFTASVLLPDGDQRRVPEPVRRVLDGERFVEA